jgi:hypothetical protein
LGTIETVAVVGVVDEGALTRSHWPPALVVAVMEKVIGAPLLEMETPAVGGKGPPLW